MMVVFYLRWIDRLSRKFRFGIPNLMIYITATMLAVFALEFVTNFHVSSYLAFSWPLILQGQLWRLLTFIFIPPSSDVIFILISLYFYYFIGSTLENAWGADHFTLYYLFGIVGTIAAGILTGYGTNYYLNMSLFFAFACLFPNHQVLLFFVIPIKIKYLAYLNAAYFLLMFLLGGWETKVAILFSLINFLLFFGPDLWKTIRDKRKYAKGRREFRRQMNQNRDMWR